MTEEQLARIAAVCRGFSRTTFRRESCGLVARTEDVGDTPIDDTLDEGICDGLVAMLNAVPLLLAHVQQIRPVMNLAIASHSALVDTLARRDRQIERLHESIDLLTKELGR